MALRYMYGFDHLSSTQQSYAFTSAASTFMSVLPGRFVGNPPLQPSNCLRIGAGVSCLLNHGLIGPEQTVHYGFALRNGQFGWGNQEVLQIWDGPYRVIHWRMNSGGLMEVRLGDGGGTFLGYFNVPFPDGWHYMEIKYKPAATNGELIIKMDGVTVFSRVGQRTTPVGLAGWVSTIQLLAGDWDDMYVLDTTGPAPFNDWYGDRKIVTLLPDANGDLQDWTVTGAPSAFQAVNEVPPNDDTSYIDTSTSGALSSFDLPSPMYAYEVGAVSAMVVARKDDAGTRIVDPLLRISGNNHIGTGTGLSGSYAGCTHIWPTNPQTGQPWTPGAVSGIQVGARLE